MFTGAGRSLLLGLLGSLLIAAVACAQGSPISGSAFLDATADNHPPRTDDSAPPDDDASMPLLLNGSDACSDACVEGGAGICGDGIIQAGEQCDDGDAMAGDGCSDTCQIESGYTCPAPGQRCVPVVACGNGRVDPGETCDDHNTTSGDGCASTCQLEPGWQCPIAGSKCIAAQCGDGIIAGNEQCDDGNAVAGDGCSATCQVEAGYACVTPPAPPPAAVCHKTLCGDGIKEGSEQCDDGNLIAYDGCSPTCTIEPKCDGNGGCTGVCGDGLVFPSEACDDGNTVSGDGCSATCQIEPGYTCSKVTQPPAATLVIPILYRDMLYFNTTIFPTPRPSGGGHPDFNAFGGAGLVTGLVQATLGPDREPVWASNGAPRQVLTSATNLCWWFHEAGCGDGGANPYDKLVYLDALGQPTTLTLASSAAGTYAYANPLFFPLDGLGWNAGTNPQVNTDCEPDPADGGALAHGMHNFSFTSELHYVFTFQASVAASASPAIFGFTGDDSVWAFINNQLVADLGGVHNPVSNAAPGMAGYPLNTANAATLGLADGGWYSIDVFQAEQHVCRSTYALTLSGFVHVVSQCQPTCGDGIVAGAEQCDTGANNVSTATAYGPGVCTTDCVLAPRCGDAVVQTQFGEQCDDGTNLATYGSGSMVCGPGCKWAPYCGDGIVEMQFGEQCDGTPGCNSMCKNGPAM